MVKFFFCDRCTPPFRAHAHFCFCPKRSTRWSCLPFLSLHFKRKTSKKQNKSPTPNWNHLRKNLESTPRFLLSANQPLPEQSPSTLKVIFMWHASENKVSLKDNCLLPAQACQQVFFLFVLFSNQPRGAGGCRILHGAHAWLILLIIIWVNPVAFH